MHKKLFRFRDNTASFNASSKRYVITNPPGNETLLELIKNVILNNIHPGTFKLLATDQVMAVATKQKLTNSQGQTHKTSR